MPERSRQDDTDRSQTSRPETNSHRTMLELSHSEDERPVHRHQGATLWRPRRRTVFPSPVRDTYQEVHWAFESSLREAYARWRGEFFWPSMTHPEHSEQVCDKYRGLTCADISQTCRPAFESQSVPPRQRNPCACVERSRHHRQF